MPFNKLPQIIGGALVLVAAIIANILRSPRPPSEPRVPPSIPSISAQQLDTTQTANQQQATQEDIDRQFAPQAIVAEAVPQENLLNLIDNLVPSNPQEFAQLQIPVQAIADIPLNQRRPPQAIPNAPLHQRNPQQRLVNRPIHELTREQALDALNLNNDGRINLQNHVAQMTVEQRLDARNNVLDRTMYRFQIYLRLIGQQFVDQTTIETNRLQLEDARANRVILEKRLEIARTTGNLDRINTAQIALAQEETQIQNIEQQNTNIQAQISRRANDIIEAHRQIMSNLILARFLR